MLERSAHPLADSLALALIVPLDLLGIAILLVGGALMYVALGREPGTPPSSSLPSLARLWYALAALGAWVFSAGYLFTAGYLLNLVRS